MENNNRYLPRLTNATILGQFLNFKLSFFRKDYKIEL